jgi:hypothetical protein
MLRYRNFALDVKVALREWHYHDGHLGIQNFCHNASGAKNLQIKNGLVPLLANVQNVGPGHDVLAELLVKKVSQGS